MKADEPALIQLRDGAETAATIAAAAAVGITGALADGPVSVDEVARMRGLDGRATRILVEALVAAGYADRTKAGFVLTRRGRAELGEDGAGAGLSLWIDNLRAWVQLPDVIASGAPVEHAGTQADEDALASYMAGMAAAPAARIERLVELCLERVPDARSILDLGGGPGHFARAFIERGLRATLVDTPETVDFVGRAYGLRDIDQLELSGADFLEDPLPKGPFDLILLSNVTHLFPPDVNRRLIRRTWDGLRPGGAIAIADFVRGRSPRAARFALVMLLRTAAGDTYAEQDYVQWLEEAGFSDHRVDDIEPERQLITSLKPSQAAGTVKRP